MKCKINDDRSKRVLQTICTECVVLCALHWSPILLEGRHFALI